MNPMLIMAAMTALSAASSAFGEKGKQGSTYSKPQLGKIEDILNDLKGMKGSQDITQNAGYQQGLQSLMNLFNDPEFFKSFEAPLQRQFQEETVPGLANRFASMGSGGATGSTAFRNQLGREGSNLSTNIAALRGNMQMNAIPQLLQYAQQPFSNYMSLLQTALNPTQNTYQGPTAGPLGNILPPIIGAYGQGWAQQQGQNMAQKFPGQSPSTY